MVRELEQPGAQPRNPARAALRAEPVPRGSPATSLNARQLGQRGRQTAGCSRLRALWVALLVAESDRRDSASSLGPVAARRSAACAAPKISFARSHLSRMTALPSCAAVPRKPMCRQMLGGASVPPASILLPRLPRAISDICAPCRAHWAHRDEHSDGHLRDTIADRRPGESGTKSRVSSCGLVVRSPFVGLEVSTTKSGLAAGDAGNGTGDDFASIRSITR